MKRFVLLIIVTAALVSGCSSVSEQQMDPALIDVTLSTEPAHVAALTPVTIQALLTGLPEQNKLQVDFELRLQQDGAKSKYIEAKELQPSTYTAETTFVESGLYAIYIHLYDAESHVTKMKELLVE